MGNADIRKADFNQMWQAMLRLSDAWHDRHGVDGRGIAGMFLQYGVTVARTAGIRLDEILELVRGQWTAVDKKNHQ